MFIRAAESAAKNRATSDARQRGQRAFARRLREETREKRSLSFSEREREREREREEDDNGTKAASRCATTMIFARRVQMPRAQGASYSRR